jgi:hypothetical protein
VIGVANVGAAALAPLLRFRRADPVQRQQLTWFAFVIVLIVVAFLVGIAVQGALPIVATVLVTVGFGGVLVGFPAAVGSGHPGRGRPVPAGPPPHPAGAWKPEDWAMGRVSLRRPVREHGTLSRGLYRADPRSTIPAVQTVPLMEDT